MELDKEDEKLFSLFKALSTVSFEVGVFDEDSQKIETVTINNLDGTTSKVEMTIDEIVYFLEHGTINIPAKNILSTIIKDMSDAVSKSISNIADRIIDGTIKSPNDILQYLQLLLADINYNIIPSSLNNNFANMNNINSLIDAEKDNTYLININKLKDYIKCKILYEF